MDGIPNSAKNYNLSSHDKQLLQSLKESAAKILSQEALQLKQNRKGKVEVARE